MTELTSELHVTLLTQWYPPEPVSQPQWIVQALRRQGLSCDVLTGIPNYPDGRVQLGYRAWRPSTESVDGVRVHRTPLYADHGSRFLKRLLNYASWSASSALLGQRTLRKADVVLVYSSPATAALAAMMNRTLHGVPYVLLVQDVWPDSILASGFLPGWPGKVAKAVIDKFVNLSYRGASALLVTSPGMRTLLTGRGVAADKITLGYNWVEATGPSIGQSPGLHERLQLSTDDFVVMYAGNHGGAQALEIVIRAFEELAGEERCHLVLVGDGIEKNALRAQAADGGSGRVHFLEPHSRVDTEAMMVSADAQLVSLADQPLFRVTTPSKLQAIMAAGQPVIAHATGDVAQIVQDADAGVTASAGDVASLVAAIRTMRVAAPTKRRQWGQNGRTYYEEHMAEPVGARLMVEVLSAAARSRVTRPAHRRLWRKTPR